MEWHAVETKPSMKPRDAVASAGKTLVELFGLARELNVDAEGIEMGPSVMDAALAADLALPIEDLDLTVRSYNCLKREGIHTVGELVNRSEADLLDIRNFGSKSIDEVKAKLVSMGMSLKDSPAGFDPRIPNGKDIVNTVKCRENFRPFAASVLEEEVSNWFEMFGIFSSPFMTFSFNIIEEKKDQVPAVVHVDGTCRIQTVNEGNNKNYYNLIKSFYKKTDVPMLLNTSFNLAGEPIVETVEDSIRTLTNSKLDYLYFPELKMVVLK